MSIIQDWKQYLNIADFMELKFYIENMKNCISNPEVLIIYGKGKTGKTTLKNDIMTYLNIDDRYCFYEDFECLYYNQSLIIFTNYKNKFLDNELFPFDKVFVGMHHRF